jgi:hypothetical protein
MWIYGKRVEDLNKKMPSLDERKHFFVTMWVVGATSLLLSHEESISCFIPRYNEETLVTIKIDVSTSLLPYILYNPRRVYLKFLHNKDFFCKTTSITH